MSDLAIVTDSFLLVLRDQVRRPCGRCARSIDRQGWWIQRSGTSHGWLARDGYLCIACVSMLVGLIREVRPGWPSGPSR